MTHLTPEEAAAVVKLRKRGDKNADLAVYWASRYQPNVAKVCMEDCDASRLAADAIEDRAALAGQVVGLREAIRTMQRRLHNIEGHNQWFERCESAWCNPSKDADPGNILSALALTPAAALAEYRREVLEEVAKLVIDHELCYLPATPHPETMSIGEALAAEIRAMGEGK